MGLLHSLLIKRHCAVENAALYAFHSDGFAHRCRSPLAAAAPAAVPITHHPVHLQKHQGDQLVCVCEMRQSERSRRSVDASTADDGSNTCLDKPAGGESRMMNVKSLSCVSEFWLLLKYVDISDALS